MPNRKRYALVGAGGRSRMYSHALMTDHKDHGELVAMCDTNRTRMAFYNRAFKDEHGVGPLPTYLANDFDKMLREQRVDAVIVTSIDRTHDHYICRAMRLDCDVITEKPMTTDAGKCQHILDTVAHTGRELKVTFNYRYAPRNERVKRALMDGLIGDVISVHFEWLLDTKHGADYFRRWHRDKRNSGGLMVHKATHHFDLVNWWLDTHPASVFATGDLRFYGRANAEQRGVTKFYDRAHGHPNAKGDPFALDLEKNDKLKGLYLDAEHEDGYYRDQSVFGDGISIEDDVAVVVKYRSAATMSYHLTAYSPWEGFRIAFNGTKGRLEYLVEEKAYVSASEGDHNLPAAMGEQYEVDEPTMIVLRPHWQKPVKLGVDQTNEGGHGGGDRRLLNHIFGKTSEDPLGQAASHIDGAMSVLTGVAANQSMQTGRSIDITSLVRMPGECGC